MVFLLQRGYVETALLVHTGGRGIGTASHICRWGKLKQLYFCTRGGGIETASHMKGGGIETASHLWRGEVQTALL